MKAAETRLDAWFNTLSAGQPVPLAALVGTLWVSGVRDIALTAPAAAVAPAALQLPVLGDVTVTTA